MGDGDGATVFQQQLRHRFPDDIGAPDYNRVHARQRAVLIAQHHQATERRARHHACLPRSQTANVQDVESVHVFFRDDGVDHQVFVDMIRNG